MKEKIEDSIRRKFKDQLLITSTDLYEFLVEIQPEAAKNTVSWYIHNLKDKGIINHVGRGIYSLNPEKPDFNPIVSNSLKRVYNKIKKDFPFANFCVWDTKWLNDFMVHQLFHYYIVVEADKDTTESIFNFFTDFSKKVFLNPDKEMYEKYISNFDEAIIIKPLISEAPLINLDHITTVSIEKLLVDCISDEDLFAAQQNELDYIFKAAFENHNVNLNKMRRYARRRNQLKTVEKYINQTLAK